MKIKILFFLFLTSCSSNETPPLEYFDWQIKRKEALLAEDGYLNIAGLFLIQNGQYSMGSDEGSDIKLPDEMPLNLSEVIVKDSIITFNYFFEVLLNDSVSVKTISYNYLSDKHSFSLGEFIWFVHIDSGVKAIRLRNMNHPLLNTGVNINFFRYSSAYVIKGKYHKYIQPKKVKFNNFLGGNFVDLIPGKINFSFQGENFWVEPTISASGNFFIAFGDKTNGNETYGGGRYLYVSPEDDDGNVILDFNKSLNPPCVFSTFTTCPVPPKENILDVKINSGEKNYDGVLFSSVYQ